MAGLGAIFAIGGHVVLGFACSVFIFLVHRHIVLPAHPSVGSALAYFEAFHLVGSSARWDALREAKETYGEELGGEEEIVMRAVRRNGAALQFASEVLRGEVRRKRPDLRPRRFSLIPPHPQLFSPSFTTFFFLFTGGNGQGGHGAVWAAWRRGHAAV